MSWEVRLKGYGEPFSEELNEEGLNQEVGGEAKELIEEGLTDEAGGQGKELNEVGLTKDGLNDEASKQSKETATMNNEEKSDKVQEKPTQGCFDKGKGKDQDMSHRVKRAFGKKRCGSLRRTKTIHHTDKPVEGRVDGVRTQSKRHSMMLRSGRRLANAADFEDEDDDASDSEDSEYMIPKNFSEDEDADEDYVFFNEWVDDQTEWTGVKETGKEAAPDWPTDVELDLKILSARIMPVMGEPYCEVNMDKQEIC
ncbi:uncharacterized protein Pyn_16375 [Prunus yedoensis var. nudiflora]|uniref:Uncharacterized protein n=1 Tax=Prunus yedoensis var. nudiflora TaxID=2094558 RepID=A0A314YFL5_PRUYE|nr:uncharacterized protein Pyn_16375 [Prunus yedoensis var. nudiflora]